ncbi:unnamed protein product [Closterium sp. Naga37s-1]|nr:unnamed protein product [Closterium sp. Naga37s-1]
MPGSPFPSCSPADSSSSRRAFLSDPSTPLPAPSAVPARPVHLSTQLCLSLAVSAFQATVTMLLPSSDADGPQVSAGPCRLLHSAAAWRAASGIRHPSSSPTALVGLTTAPPRCVPLATGHASLVNWAPPCASLPGASIRWVRLAHPPILPCASAATPANACCLRPSPPVSAACRESEGCQALAPNATLPPLSRASAPPCPFRALLASPQRRRLCPVPAALADATSLRRALHVAPGSSLSCPPSASSTSSSGFAPSPSAFSSLDVSHSSSSWAASPSLVM